MIKGQRVYQEDLVEMYPFELAPYYATYHDDMLMLGPYQVVAAGKRRLLVVYEDGHKGELFCGDTGLVPYGVKDWNKHNATFMMLPEPVWQDDWM